ETARRSAANIPTPVAYDGYVYSSTGQAGGGLVKLAVSQGSVEAIPVYAGRKLPSSIGGAGRVGGDLYGTARPGVVRPGFKTGNLKWENRGIGAGALCFADGRLYVHGENGQVALVEATPEGYREKGRFTPPDAPDRGQAQAWTYPVVANGRLYIRDVG